MTAEQFINQYVKGINESEFIKIAASVGIGFPNGFEKNRFISNDEINRLLNNSQINNHRANNSFIGKQSGYSSEYDEILKKYDELLSIPAGKKGALGPEERAEIQSYRDRLFSEKTNYEAVLNGLQRRNSQADNSFLFTKDSNGESIIDNGIAQGTVNIAQGIQNNYDDKLSEKYQEIDKLQNELYFIRSDYKRKKQQRRIARIQNKINKLKKRQGKVRNIQTRIVSRNANRYFKKTNRNMRVNAQEASMKLEYANNVTQNRQERANLDYDLSQSESELSSYEQSGKFSDRLRALDKKMEINSLKRKSNRAQRKIDGLKRMNGFVDLATQYRRSAKGMNL